MYKDTIFKLGEFSLEAMLYEVSSYPSFGLVSPINSGSHDDMDYFTFIDSSSRLYRYFLEIAHLGYSSKPIHELFLEVREIGKRAEKAMFDKTKGVNTHKGMIFVLGLGVLATSKVLYENLDFSEIPKLIRKMTAGIVTNELKNIDNKTNLTHGEKLFLDFGITGVRGEAENGFSIVFDFALQIYEEIRDKEKDMNIVLTHTLLAIMSKCEDSTILHRHNYESLNKMQRKSKKILEEHKLNSENTLDNIKSLDNYNIKNKISPGGCADLLALTIFVAKVRDEFYDKNNKPIKWKLNKELKWQNNLTDNLF